MVPKVGSSAPMTLQSFLQPVGVNDFFDHYYEAKPLFLTGRSIHEVYPGFPGLEDFEELLWKHQDKLKHALRVNRGGKYFQPPPPSQGKDMFRWAIDQFADGCTLILNGTDDLCVPVARLARTIESETGGRVAGNAFLTPANSRGFLPHFDTHDIFVVQLEGSKVWRLYDRRIELPVDRQIHLIDQNSVGELTAEYRLSKGDLLYIPRGIVHGPYTDNDLSLHITLGFRPLRWSDYINALVEIVVEREPTLRRSIKRLDLKSIAAALPAHLDTLIRASNSSRICRLAMERSEQRFNSKLRPLPGGHILSALRAEHVQLDTRVRRRQESVCHVYEVEDRVRLQFPGVGLVGGEDLQPGCIEAPLMAGGAYRQIASSNAAFTAEDLPRVLAAESRLELIRVLVREGLLIMADSE